MRRQIQEVPKRLPHARLFLDDLETINNIMVEEMSEQFKADVARYAVPEVGEDSNVPATFEPRITYLLGNIEMDSLDDLLQEGGSVTDLDIHFQTRSYRQSHRLSFDKWSKPSVSLYGLERNKQWGAYGKIRVVFDKRRMFLRNLLVDLPEWLTLVSWIFVTAGLGFIDIIGRHLSTVATVILVAYLLNFLLVALGLLVYSTVHSRVYLVRSHERSKASAETRQKYTIGAITFLLGALSTKLLDLLIRRLFK